MAHRLASGLRRARQEPSAFTDFYTAHSRRLLVFFARRTFDVEAARDLTAETFAHAFEHRRFRGSTDAEAQGWLYGIARHQLSRYARSGVVERKAVERLGIRLPAVGVDDYGRIVELAGLAQLRERVAAAFGELSDGQRDALRLLVETGVDGGFILLADAACRLHALVAYDAAGQELERVDLGYLDTRDFCKLEPTCLSP